MDIVQTVSYIFDDDDWVTKLIITGAVVIGTSFAGILIGLVFVAALHGWTIHLIRNMINDEPNPMPTWDDFGAKMQLGVQPTVAWILYFLPLTIVVCVLVALPIALAGGNVDDSLLGVVGVSTLCFVIPFTIAYLILANLFFTVGTIRYAQTEQMSAYLNVGTLWRTITRNASTTGEYILYSILIAFGLILVHGLPVIGSLAAIALQAPVTGNLLGQYALALGGKAKR